jgi:hypothetical protein
MHVGSRHLGKHALETQSEPRWISPRPWSRYRIRRCSRLLLPARGPSTSLGSIFGLGLSRPLFADRVRPFLQRFTSAAPTLLNFAIIGLTAALGEETLFRLQSSQSQGYSAG